MRSRHSSLYPQHWDLLNDTDKSIYLHLSAALSAPSSRNKRNKRADDFQQILEAIELFENWNEPDKWKRCLVCGICRIPNGIAVHTAQLKKLISKCKSSINGSLKCLGYDIVLPKASSCQELLNAIPQLQDHHGELRKWTIRMFGKGDSMWQSPEFVPEIELEQPEWDQISSAFFDSLQFDSSTPVSKWQD
jgi:hypothetical protein